MEHILAKDLRESVLQYAFEGKLTRHMATDSDIVDVLNEIEEQKKDLIKKKTIKKEQPLNSLQDDEIPFDIPDYWKWEKIGNLVDCGSGSTPLKGHPEFYTNGIIPWLKTGELTNTYITKCEDKITEEAFKKGSFRVNKPGDILIAMYGATIGKLGICTFDLTTNQACLGCTPYCGLNNMFLFYYFKATKNALIGKAEGGAQPNISRIKVRNHPIPLPPIEEQQRIVDKVEELMAKIDEYEKIENQLVQLKEEFPGDMRDAILQAAMQGKITKSEPNDSDVFDIKIKHENLDELDFDVPEKWSCAKMINVSTVATGNSIPEAIKKSKYTNIKNGFNYIGTKDVGFNRKITYENGVKIPYDEPNFKYSEPGSTLLCIEGGSAGKKIAMTEQKVCYGNKLCSFHTETINKKYLYYYLQSSQFSNIFIDNLSGMIGGVSINKLKDIILPIPPIEEQQRIVDLLDKVLPLCDSLQS